MLFFYEPAQNLLCSFAIFERFLINTPKVCSLFDTTRLSRYKGVDGGKIYLSILGNVFDVTEGRRFYGPGGSYSGFSGRDASRSFITGLFDEENLTDHVSDMDPNDLIGLDTWINTYKKKYKEIGKLIGRYYDSSGKETDYCKLVFEKIKSSKMAKVAKNEEMAKYPSCNIEYVQENQKSKVWCTKLSGGIQRNWIGVPRKLQSLDENGKLSIRCACVQLDTLSKAELMHINEYEDCDANATTCYVTIS
ncbi:unnamed protein product [Macrosiphum euphorbiae]|nr:unnamed protein product [Macrosiphum euphorbiae]